MSRVPPLPSAAWAFLVYLLLAVAASWPLVLELDETLFFHVSRFDGYGTVWFGEHTLRAVTGQGAWLSTTDVAWPNGLDLRQADSFMFGLMYVPFRIFLGPVASFNAFSLAAIAGTGAAGFWLATGPLRTSSLAGFASGLVMAFNSLMHTYRVEGEAYLLAGFFLPLFGGYLLRSARNGLPRDGVLAGLSFAGLAWSSGYYAVDGLIVATVLGFSLLALTPREPPSRGAAPAVGAFALTSLVTILPLAWIILGAFSEAVGARTGTEDPLLNVAMDSVSLSGIAVPYSETAFLRQGRIHYLGSAGVAFALVGLTTRSFRETIPWFLLAATGVLLSLGPSLRLDDADPGGMTMLYAWIYEVAPGILAYRMPARFLALTYLGMGALVALFLDRLRSEGLGRGWRLSIVALLLVDGLWMTGFVEDVTEAPAEVPSGYANLSEDGAVLDFWGRDPKMLRYAGLSTFYQAHHGRPVMTDFTRSGDAQEVLSRRLAVAGVEEREDELLELLNVLGHLGVTDIAWHPESFHDDDAVRLRRALARYTSRSRSDDEDTTQEADPVEVYRIAAPEAGTPEEARTLLEGWMELEG